MESSDIPWEKGIDEVAAGAIEVVLACATGRAPGRPLPDPGDTAVLEGADLSWAQFGDAARLALTGDTGGAMATALLAVDGYGELYDDFLHMWAFAADLACATGDRAVEQRLLTMVDSANIALPLGLRAHRARAAGLIAARDGQPLNAGAEALLRTAVDLYSEWGALPYHARSQAELGNHLASQGREDEATPLLEESRALLTSVGAKVWLQELGLIAAPVPVNPQPTS